MDFLLGLLVFAFLNVLAVGAYRKGWRLTTHQPRSESEANYMRSLARIWVALVFLMDAALIMMVLAGVIGFIWYATTGSVPR